MNVTTKRDMIRKIAKRWKTQYYSQQLGGWAHINTGSSEEIYNKLNKLDLDKCSENDITKTIGTKGWCNLICDECDKSVEATIMLGQTPDYESATCELCMDCLKKAMKLMEKKIS